MRYLLSKIVAYLFSRFITVLRLNPGDVLIVYDPEVLDLLAAVSNKDLAFQIPLIDGHCTPGEEHEILRKLSFQEFNKVWNMAYHSYAEAQWKIAQDRYYLYQGPQGKSQVSHPLRRFLRRLDSIRLKLVEWVDGLGRKPNVQQLEATLPKQGLIAGRGEKQVSELVKRQSQNS